MIAINPDAVNEAHVLDVERAKGRARGPLHGIPKALKDNIHTTNMPTTGGALGFDRFIPPYEATLVTKLRAADAIILSKTVLTELANWVAGAPTPMPANYSAVGGFGLNRTIHGRIPGRDSTMGARRCRPAGRARGSAPPPTSGSQTSGRRPRARS